MPAERVPAAVPPMIGMRQRLWKAIGEALFGDPDQAAAREEEARVGAQAVAPTWCGCFGKTGAGKTAIVAALYGRSARRSRRRVRALYAHRNVLRSAAGGAAAALSRYSRPRQGRLRPGPRYRVVRRPRIFLLVVMQVNNPVQEAVLSVARAARRRHGEWPLVVAQTGLHRLTRAGTGHPQPYPYTGSEGDVSDPKIPHGLGKRSPISASCSPAFPDRRRVLYPST